MERIFLNEKEALGRFMGSRNLYVRLLKTFLADQTTEKFKQALAQGNLKDAEFYAHSIKGMVANLSLTEAYHAVVAADELLKKDIYDEAVCAKMIETIAETVVAVEKYIGN